VSDALAAAAKENPALQSSARSVEISAERQTSAAAGYYPTLDVVAKANYEHNKEGVIGVRRDWAALAQLNWELFSGFRTQSSVAQASYDHAASRDTHSQQSRKVAEQVRLSWHSLMTARERLGIIENAVNLAQEVFDLRRKQREAGKATVMDVLDSESDIYNARINYVSASYDARLAIYQLLAAMGRIDLKTVSQQEPRARG
ncbi:MAG: TolC family protein, partial [Rhodospirillales bacterium]|nr:TolC family protein [Rhodospirillales bacterium]